MRGQCCDCADEDVYSMNDLTELAGLYRYPPARRGLMMGGLMSGFTLAG
jgi:hypothetical protein